jgi:hypothetical protein
MRALPLALFACLSVVTGCTGGVAPIGHEEQSLTTLPDCSAAKVGGDFQAAPTSIAEVYIVRIGTNEVCTTDFSGLQLLAERSSNLPALPPLGTADSDPMPGRGDDPLEQPTNSDPMPGHGTDPAASDPMPGRGDDPLASDPMPGRSPDALRITARELAAR